MLYEGVVSKNTTQKVFTKYINIIFIARILNLSLNLI